MSLQSFLTDWDAATWDRTFTPTTGVSSTAAGQRLESMLREICDPNTAASAIVVSHGGVTVDLLRNLLGDGTLEDLAPGVIAHGLPGGSLTTLSFDGHSFAVVNVGQTDHLRPADRSGWLPA